LRRRGASRCDALAPPAQRRFRPLVLLRNLFIGGRLTLGLAAGAVVFAVLPAAWPPSLRVALAWIASAAFYLALTAVVMAGASPERLRGRARQLDPRRWVILAIIVVAGAISLLALGFTLHKAPGESMVAGAARVVVTGLAIAASWALTHTTFALHYAHHYYGDGSLPGEDDRGGLAFPGGEEPDYWDLLYFALVIGMTCQVSDVQVTSRAMRRITLLHSVLSFFFNTIILALAVNLLAGSFSP
jgi:uncharacterized membrane protein